jgi:hypothetical protein
VVRSGALRLRLGHVTVRRRPSAGKPRSGIAAVSEGVPAIYGGSPREVHESRRHAITSPKSAPPRSGVDPLALRGRLGSSFARSIGGTCYMA